ncbi:FtsQ-type POTRA domain-containing protein [Candidatus Roizmanbacteria bacterium]|nr:FtsQ-type POTRA domain-containing protein [Candidatus Roizmanbacteria bacterium]
MLILIFLDRFFHVQTITIHGVPAKTTLRGLENLYSNNLFFFDEDVQEKYLASNNPIVKTIHIARKFPNAIIVIVTLADPIAYFSIDGGYLLVSEEGKVLAKTREVTRRYPLIHYYQRFSFSSWQSGDTIQYGDVLSALFFLKKALDLGLAIDTIDISGLSMIALQLKDQKILFTTEKDRAIQEYQFSTIIKQFSIEGKRFDVLDLRFDKPVIQVRSQ